MEAARLGQLFTVRELLDGGTATVEDRDEVKSCVCVLEGGEWGRVFEIYSIAAILSHNHNGEVQLFYFYNSMI